MLTSCYITACGIMHTDCGHCVRYIADTTMHPRLANLCSFAWMNYMGQSTKGKVLTSCLV